MKKPAGMKKHTQSRPKSTTAFPKGYNKGHDKSLIARYVQEFDRLNHLKAIG